MKFEYSYRPVQSERGTLFRPILSVDVKHSNQLQTIDFIVDSGADSSMLGKEAALALGMDLQGGEWRDVYGIAGKIRCFKRTVQLTVPGFEDEPFDAVVWASDKLNVNLLGHDNFFHKFNVGFNSKEKKLVLDDRK